MGIGRRGGNRSTRRAAAAAEDRDLAAAFAASAEMPGFMEQFAFHLPPLPDGVTLIDSHCHLDMDFDADRDAVLARAARPASRRW